MQAANLEHNAQSQNPSPSENGNGQKLQAPMPIQYGCQPASDFVVTWRNLKFAIEPKWHQRVVNASSVARLSGSATSKTATDGAKTQQAPAGPQQNQSTKVVLDRLDGSFRSGELTAILGPSGK